MLAMRLLFSSAQMVMNTGAMWSLQRTTRKFLPPLQRVIEAWKLAEWPALGAIA
jgi:hypothetical protein